MELRQACRAAGIGVVAASEHVGRPRLHRALPALSARLVVSPGTPIEVRYDGHAQHMQAVVAGLMRPGVATPSLILWSHQPMVYVDLSPLAMQRLTGVPPSEVQLGAELVIPIENRPYGKRQGRVKDPFGHLWVISGDLR